MINCFNTFDRLKEVILGDVDQSVIKFCPEKDHERLHFIFKKAKEDLNVIQKVLESYEIKVHRPNSIINSSIKTPYFENVGNRIPLTPRDSFLIMGDTLIDCASWDKSCFFQSFYYRNFLIQHLTSGGKWIQMPAPRHDYINLSEQNEELLNQDPILDGASVCRYGKDIFITGSGSVNELGETWLMNNFPDYRYHKLDKKVFKGHLDSHFAILKPGLLLTYHAKENLPSYFKNWNIIHIDPRNDQSMSMQQKLIDSKVQDEDFSTSVLAINCLSLSPDKVMMFDHYNNNEHLLKEFEKYKIEIVFVPFSFSHFFNQGMSCVSFDVVRETEGCIDYTK